MLAAEGLGVAYGPLQALRDLSLHVERGQIVTVLGANGAGKSSLVRALCGLIPPFSGAIRLDGRRIDGMRPEQRVALGMATVAEGRDLFGSLTVEENLKMGAYLRKRGSELARDLEWVYTLFPALLSKRRAVAATLSGGEGQMLAIGRALMAAPRLLLLDEPSQGLAPVLVDQSFELIARLRTDRDMGILLVEQNANKALEVASYGYVLEAGALAFEGTTAELQSSTRVRELYLGG